MAKTCLNLLLSNKEPLKLLWLILGQEAGGTFQDNWLISSPIIYCHWWPHNQRTYKIS